MAKAAASFGLRATFTCALCNRRLVSVGWGVSRAGGTGANAVSRPAEADTSEGVAFAPVVAGASAICGSDAAAGLFTGGGAKLIVVPVARTGIPIIRRESDANSDDGSA